MKDEIKAFFKGEVEDDLETLARYSRDASVFEVRPQVVVFPKDSTDVQNLVRWVGENTGKYEGLSITARCAGTDMSGGAIGESIIMDFTRHMNKLVGGPLPIDPKRSYPGGTYKAGKNIKTFAGYPLVPSYITVEPGMFYRDFEKITSAKGLVLPCYTASKSLNAMGGMFGNNSAGERTLKYGQTQEYILETKIVFADGVERVVKPIPVAEVSKQNEIYAKVYDLIKENETEIKKAKPNVRKNASGYYAWNVISEQSSDIIPRAFEGSKTSYFDLNKLLVGSQGTLGIATEITFKLVPENKHSKLVVIFMKDLAPLGLLVDEVLTLKPETFETYDDKTMRLAVRFFPDFLKNRGFFGMIKFMWSFLPEFFMMLRGGLPKLILLVEFAGKSEDEVNTQCLKLEETIKHFKLRTHITESEAEANKYWDIRRESFALLRKHVKGKHTAPFIDDIIVRPEFLPKFLPELSAILGGYNLTFTLAGHAGDGNFHIIPLMDFKRPDTAKIIMKLSEKVYDLVSKYHGSITAEHNDGIIRTPYLEKIYTKETLRIFAKIKNIFDPKNILNPGKKVPTQNQGGTKEYIASHVAVEHDVEHKV